MSLSKLFNAGVRLLFFKAKRRGDDHTADLFPVEVPVKGHTTKDGTYVDPHTAIRYKKQPQPKKPEEARREQAPVADLFGETEAPAPKPSATPTFIPTHELPDGTKVAAHPDEPNVWVDADGMEYESGNTYPLEQAHRVATKRTVNAANNDDEAAKYALPEGATFCIGSSEPTSNGAFTQCACVERTVNRSANHEVLGREVLTNSADVVPAPPIGVEGRLQRESSHLLIWQYWIPALRCAAAGMTNKSKALFRCAAIIR